MSSSGKCTICSKPSTDSCGKCRKVYYCSRDHQVQDWKQHKLTCMKEQTQPIKIPGGQDLIDQDNLNQYESVGTFRWNDSTQLIDAPKFQPDYIDLLNELEQGWKTVALERFESIADPKTNKVKIEPHQIDGLSYPMTLVNIIQNYGFKNVLELNIVIMGASGKVEERLYIQTNYFEELTNFFPKTKFNLFFVGPETSQQNSDKTFKKNERLQGKMIKNTVKNFISKNDFDINKTILIGYNPGFGSGYDKLLYSWCRDLVYLLDKNFHIFFTQANDYSDVRGEDIVLKTIFEDKINYTLQVRENPFRAMTNYCNEGNQSLYSCSSTHFYGIRGWKQPLTLEQVNQNLNSKKCIQMLKLLQKFALGS